MIIEERDRSYLQRIVEYCERREEARKQFGDNFEDYVDNIMKKQVCIFMILIMCLSLCACGGNSSDSSNNSDTMESYVGNTYEL